MIVTSCGSNLVLVSVFLFLCFYVILCFPLFCYDVLRFDFGSLCSSCSFDRVQRCRGYEALWRANWCRGSWFAWHCCQAKRGFLLSFVSSVSICLSIDSWFCFYPCSSFCEYYFGCGFVGQRCGEIVLGWCKRETSRFHWRSEAKLFGLGKQRSWNNSKVTVSSVLLLLLFSQMSLSIFLFIKKKLILFMFEKQNNERQVTLTFFLTHLIKIY